MKSFFKYQGLGNEFIMLDWQDQPYQEALGFLDSPSWATQVQDLCERDNGIGADGLIVILRAMQQPTVHALLYNSDGSYASFCGNGARCVADYLHKSRHYPNSFKIMMGSREVDCQTDSLITGETGITTIISPGSYLGTVNIAIAGKNFTAHKVDVGNPHLVILEEIGIDWLKKYGEDLEFYFGKSQRHNIEFIWQSGSANHYKMLVHERGAGITQACGSGAMASVVVLDKLALIGPQEKITIEMLGGDAIVWLNANKEIALHAQAQQVLIVGKQLNHDKMPQPVIKSID
jgi:diaminopimelate epimerase